ncbi:hypothetical protein Tco_0116829 [Tanacetum coccineum]
MTRRRIPRWILLTIPLMRRRRSSLQLLLTLHHLYQIMFPQLRRQSHLRLMSLLLHHHHPILLFQPQTPLPPSIKARIAEYGSAPTLPLPPPSLLSPLSSLLLRIPSPPLLLPPTRPLHTSPTYARALLGYKAAMI